MPVARVICSYFGNRPYLAVRAYEKPLVSSPSTEVAQPGGTADKRRRLSPFLGISLLLFGTAIWGFWQSYFLPLMTSGADRSWLIHLHAAVFTGWMFLLLAQSLAISFSNVQFHRRLGVAGMSYAVLVFLLGLVVSVAVPVAGATAGNFPIEIAGLVAVYLITDMLVFAAFMAGAMAYRTKPAFHKRLIICATVALTTAAVGREMPVGSLSFYVVWLAPIFVLIGVDLTTRKRPHVVSVFGLVVLTLAFFKNGFLEGLAVSRTVGLFIVSSWI